jgi:hypothetical protein
MRSKAVAWAVVFYLETVGSQARCSGSDRLAGPLNVRYWGNNGQQSILASDGLSANDRKRTLSNGRHMLPSLYIGRLGA